MKIYTKGGDKGETSLFGGSRVSKSHERIEAYGTIDELNAYIGLLNDQEVNKNRKTILKRIQDSLFVIGSILAVSPEKNNIQSLTFSQEEIDILENEIDDMEEKLSPLTNFILPGGHASVSFAHVARCVCRRAERNVVRLSESNDIHPDIIPYLNRLSDYLFVLSRKMAHELNVEEIIWVGRNNK